MLSSRSRLLYLLAVCVSAVLLVVPALASAATRSRAGTAAGSGGSGGSGIPTVRKLHRRRHRVAAHHTTTRTTTRANTVTTNHNDGITAPVVRDGGSAHLGERTIHPGMTGHDVRVLQSYLTMAGYATPVDGSYGPTTQSSVIGFQAAHSLKANGVVTYADSLVLRQAVVTAMAGGALGTATINSDGTASAPAGAPAAVQQMIAAANRIIDTPYVYGGGHQSFNAGGYDCSGAVSYALHGAGLLSAPADSTGLESFGAAGPGRWVTVYGDAGHAFIVIAGIAFDTADYGGPNIPSGSGPRWRTNPTGNLADGGSYVVRHPSGL